MYKPGLSFWEKESFFKDIDFTIIGSGIVGLNAAITIKNKYPSSNVIVLEKGMIPSGASTRNAGFSCFGSISELLDDLEMMSEDEVLELVEKRWAGLQRLISMVGKDLGHEYCGGYELFRKEDNLNYKKCEERIDYFNHKLEKIIGKKRIYKNADNEIKKFGFQGIQHLILNQAEGQIHTGNMMKKLLSIAKTLDISIFNGAEVTNIEEDKNSIHLELNDGRKIVTNKLLIATNGFSNKIIKEIDLTPARNQVLITQPIPNLKVMGTFHYDEGYYYFRNVGNRILFGGGRNLNPKREETDSFGITEDIKSNLINMLGDIILPETPFKIDMWWSGILGVGKTKKPIIKKISNRIAIAVRMGGMGVAIGSLVGEEGAMLLCD